MNIPSFPGLSAAKGGQTPGKIAPPQDTKTPGQPGSGTLPGLPGGLPNIPGMPAEAAEILKNLPGGSLLYPGPLRYTVRNYQRCTEGRLRLRSKGKGSDKLRRKAKAAPIILSTVNRFWKRFCGGAFATAFPGEHRLSPP